MLTDSPFTQSGPVLRGPQADRCDGSGQVAMLAADETECPVCRKRVSTERVDGSPQLVEHRRGSSDGMTLALW